MTNKVHRKALVGRDLSELDGPRPVRRIRVGRPVDLLQSQAAERASTEKVRLDVVSRFEFERFSVRCRLVMRRWFSNRGQCSPRWFPPA